MYEFSKYVGLDTHKDTTAVSVSDACGGKPRYYGEIANTPEEITKLAKKLNPDGEVLSFCYEAGSCGYGIYRQISKMGHDCSVVAPSLIPHKPGDRIKTDRRDSESLSRFHRAGELTAVWVPDQEQEAIRDLTRAREDMKAMERQARQRLNAFLLRHGKVYESGKSKWTQTHFRWLERVKFEIPVQQIVFEEYIGAIKQSQQRAIIKITFFPHNACIFICKADLFFVFYGFSWMEGFFSLFQCRLGFLDFGKPSFFILQVFWDLIAGQFFVHLVFFFITTSGFFFQRGQVLARLNLWGRSFSS